MGPQMISKAVEVSSMRPRDLFRGPRGAMGGPGGPRGSQGVKGDV